MFDRFKLDSKHSKGHAPKMTSKQKREAAKERRARLLNGKLPTCNRDGLCRCWKHEALAHRGSHVCTATCKEAR